MKTGLRGASIVEAADLLGFSCATLSRLYQEWCDKRDNESAAVQLGKKIHHVSPKKRMERLAQGRRWAASIQITTVMCSREVGGQQQQKTTLVVGDETVRELFSWHTVDGQAGPNQQDNAPCQEAWIISRWFQGHDSAFSFLPWPAQCAGLNPLDTFGVERDVHRMDLPPQNAQEQRDAASSSSCSCRTFPELYCVH